MIRTPDQRLRVFVSSTLGELAEERLAVRRAIERLHLSPVMFELGARPHPPRELYRAYLGQSDVFVGIYWERYGWVAPGEAVSGLEDEYRLARRLPQLLYIKHPAPDRDAALSTLLRQIQGNDQASYRRFSTPEDLEELVSQDLALLLSERFDAAHDHEGVGPSAAPVPVPLTRTIGRDEDVARIVRLVDSGVRLVTVTGPGGVGKTRLALEAARAAAGRPGSEVYFVPLAAVSSPSLVLAGVADQLGVRDGSGGSPYDSLVEYFGGRSAMLVLDNLEQVVAAGPELARLLEQAPRLQVLATSRQALRVVGEHEFPAGPLDVPSEAASLDEVRRAPAVQLLLERARERGVRLELTAQNSRAVTDLCRRLAGLPLAIELAVPRLRLLSPQRLLERLDSTLDLSSAGEDLPSRQRTLRAALTWSHDLLDGDERALLARMSVFAGGATLDGVEAVCSSGRPVEASVASLLDKSLLVVGNPMPDGELRIQMLEPVHDFASEQLDIRGEKAEIQRRHLEYFAALGRQAQPFLCGPRQREWAARFDAERANVRAAIETGLATQAFGTVLRMCWDTFVYYYVRDGLEEAQAWILRLAHEAEPLTGTEQALLDVALMIVGEPSAAHQPPEVLLEAATGVFDDGDLPLEAAVSRHHLGLHHWRAGRRVPAIETLDEASRRYAAIDHDWGVAMVEMTLGAAHAGEGRRDLARAHFERSLARSRRIDNRPQIAQGLQGLALVAALDQRLDPGMAALTEAVDIVLTDRSVAGATYCLESLAAVLLARRHPEEAVRLISAARSTRSRRGVPEWTAAEDAAEPVIAAARRALSASSFAEHWRAGAAPALDVFDLLSSRLALVAEGSGSGVQVTPASL